MARTRSPRRNPYRPGTATYARLREVTLKRRVAVARANAARAKTPEARRRAKQRVSAAQRALRAIEMRENFRSELNKRDRSTFDSVTITEQSLFIKGTEEYPESIPKDIPDLYYGRHREALWRLYYSTRAGIRLRAAVRPFS